MVPFDQSEHHTKCSHKQFSWHIQSIGNPGDILLGIFCKQLWSTVLYIWHSCSWMRHACYQDSQIKFEIITISQLLKSERVRSDFLVARITPVLHIWPQKRGHKMTIKKKNHYSFNLSKAQTLYCKVLGSHNTMKCINFLFRWRIPV